jgi:hypothetical protein
MVGALADLLERKLVHHGGAPPDRVGERSQQSPEATKWNLASRCAGKSMLSD